MDKPERLPTIGILGCGFLGRELRRLFRWGEGSWGTRWSPANEDAPGCASISFDWGDSRHWSRMPEGKARLVLTIPPLAADRGQERKRLQEWCRWLKHNRPEALCRVYISSTGVYPHQSGLWSEEAVFEADTPQGRLRLETEAVLADYFDVRIIRSGAIYGPGRHLGRRLQDGLPIPQGRQPVPRIHVTDLAWIIMRALTAPSFPAVVNAVDLDPAPSSAVIDWLRLQHFTGLSAETQPRWQTDLLTRKHEDEVVDRIIDNRRLVSDLQYRFLFPTYREGLRQVYGDSGSE